jgi:hypothetical protein
VVNVARTVEEALKSAELAFALHVAVYAQLSSDACVVHVILGDVLISVLTFGDQITTKRLISQVNEGWR